MKIELIEGGKMPERMSDGAVGFDCYAREVELHTTPIHVDKFSIDAANGGYATTGGATYGATIKLGFKVDCSKPHDYVGGNRRNDSFNGYGDANFGAFLFPRSGWARKYGFRLKNTIGVIDPDYRGEVIAEVEFDECPPELLEYANSECNGCAEYNECEADCSTSVSSQPRACQMVFLPCYVGALMQVEKLDDTERGANGFGSTGHG